MIYREYSLFKRIFTRLILYKCHLLLAAVAIIMVYILFRQYAYGNKILTNKQNVLPIVLWWTPFTGIAENLRVCSKGSCIFTENRKYFQTDKAAVILFYGSDFKIDDLPLPRTTEWWGLLHEESPKNQPIFDHLSVLKLFNITSTFKSSSGMPLTLQYLQGVDTLTSGKYYKPINAKTRFQTEKDMAPIIYLQSDCDPPSERDEFVRELSNYIEIDSYGSCLNNKQLSAGLEGIENMNSDEILDLISKYKYSLALENSACEDYITEKLWRPLSVGTIPIYWGAPNVEQWLPNEGSVISVRDFSSPRDLASYLFEVSRNDISYESHLRHKIYKEILNQKLIKELSLRQWGINEDQSIKGTFVESFECFVCDKIIEYKNSLPGTFVAGLKDYGCPAPETILHKNETINNFWLEQWHKAKVEADVLSEFLTRTPGTFTIEQFYDKVIKILKKQGHFKKYHFIEEL